MQMIKYEGNFIHRLFDKIRKKRSKEPVVEEKISIENVEDYIQKEIDYEAITGCKKYIPSSETLELASEFECDQSIMKSLIDDQIVSLIEYYKEKSDELDREILFRRKKIDKLVKQLNDYYEQAKKDK